MSLQNLVNVIAGFVKAQSWSTFQVSFLLPTMSDAQKWTLTMTKNTFDFEITHPRDLTQKKKKITEVFPTNFSESTTRLHISSNKSKHLFNTAISQQGCLDKQTSYFPS